MFAYVCVNVFVIHVHVCTQMWLVNINSVKKKNFIEKVLVVLQQDEHN